MATVQPPTDQTGLQNVVGPVVGTFTIMLIWVTTYEPRQTTGIGPYLLANNLEMEVFRNDIRFMCLPQIPTETSLEAALSHTNVQQNGNITPLERPQIVYDDEGKAVAQLQFRYSNQADSKVFKPMYDNLKSAPKPPELRLYVCVRYHIPEGQQFERGDEATMLKSYVEGGEYPFQEIRGVQLHSIRNSAIRHHEKMVNPWGYEPGVYKVVLRDNIIKGRLVGAVYTKYDICASIAVVTEISILKYTRRETFKLDLSDWLQ